MTLQKSIHPGKAKGCASKKNRSLIESLRAIINLKPGKMPKPKTNADVLAARLWNYALVAAPSNPKGLNAIVEIFDRLEGKAAPSEGELDAMKNSGQITFMLPRTNDSPKK